MPTQPTTDSIILLARDLIRIPSQGGIDSPQPVLQALGEWLETQGLPAQVLLGPDRSPVALLVEVGPKSGPTYCLNACVDTAPIGDENAWSVSAIEGAILDGWLFGRGAADSKIAVAMFAHLALAIALEESRLAARLSLLFDADEHTGGFGGIKAYLATEPSLAGVMIGYPGNYGIVVGGRGFWRAQVHIVGTASHSGSRKLNPDNAVVKGAELVRRLNALQLPEHQDELFDLPPKLTVTAIRGGQGHSVVPDRCSVQVDVRLTPSFDAAAADALIRRIRAQLDKDIPSRLPSTLQVEESWPAYRLPDDSKLARTLRLHASRTLGRELPLVIAGPSNIGNYLHSRGIEATCGFGVTYRNIHAPDESVEIASIPPVFEAYRAAALDLLVEEPVVLSRSPRRTPAPPSERRAAPG